MRDIKEIPEPTTKCNECFYYKEIMGVRTCGLAQAFLRPLVTGCYGGWKSRNIEAENYRDGVKQN